MTKRLLIIPARSGSKRIKNKNIKIFNGKPIIFYSILEALKSGLFSNIHVSTDSTRIKKIVEKIGLKIEFLRPKHLAGDYTPTVDVLRYVYNKFKKKNFLYDEIWCLTPCSPLIKSFDLISSSKLLKKHRNKIVISVSKYNVPIEWAFTKKKNKLIPVKKNFYKKRSQDLEFKYHDSGNFVGIPNSFFFKKKN